MKAKAIVLPFLALGGAATLILPGSEATASFTVTGESLNTGQRDVRTFNNYTDPQSNDNMIVYGMFPGWIGAEQATWKAVVEWGSTPHGSGGGDPTQSNLGDGGANFDAAWMGNANGVGTPNDNIISAVSSCSTGVVAYAELPASDGWRIRMCDGSWVFNDGPSFINGGHFDMQGIITHEYGHVLGLGHSCTGAATMAPSGSPGSVSLRSIHPDDVAGIQAIYGAASSAKPVICEVEAGGGNVTIRGRNFSLTSNTVWFTNSAVTATGIDPRILVSNVASTNGTEITLAIPAGASEGDVLVKIPGGNNGTGLSNAFPCNFNATLTSNNCPFGVAGVTSPIPALDPGTAQTFVITGSGFNDVTGLDLNLFTPIPSSRWTIVNDTTITVDMPQTGFLGANSITVKTASQSQIVGFDVVEVATPQIEIGTGDPGNVIASGTNMNFIVAGKVGTLNRVYYSLSNLPSVHPVVSFAIGNNFTDLRVATAVNIGAAGYQQYSIPITYTAPAMTFYGQSVDLTTPPSPTYAVSNVQEFVLQP